MTYEFICEFMYMKNRQIQTTQFAFNFPSNFPSFKTLIIREVENFAFPKLHSENRAGSQFSFAMPTVRDHPRMMSYPHFWKSLERTKLRNNAALVLLMNVLTPSLATLHALRKEKYFARLLMLTMHRSMQLLLMSALLSIAVEREINRKRSTNILPADPAWRSKPALNFYHPCWASEEGELLFYFRFRFRVFTFCI